MRIFLYRGAFASPIIAEYAEYLRLHSPRTKLGIFKLPGGQRRGELEGETANATPSAKKIAAIVNWSTA